MFLVSYCANRYIVETCLRSLALLLVLLHGVFESATESLERPIIRSWHLLLAGRTIVNARHVRSHVVVGVTARAPTKVPWAESRMVFELYKETDVPVVLLLVTELKVIESRVDFFEKLEELGVGDEDQGFPFVKGPDVKSEYELDGADQEAVC